MEIGAQQLSNDFLRADQELQEIFALFGRQFVPLSTQPIDAGEAAGLELQAQDAPSSGPFWESLGFEVKRIYGWSALLREGGAVRCAAKVLRRA